MKIFIIILILQLDKTVVQLLSKICKKISSKKKEKSKICQHQLIGEIKTSFLILKIKACVEVVGVSVQQGPWRLIGLSKLVQKSF